MPQWTAGSHACPVAACLGRKILKITPKVMCCTDSERGRARWSSLGGDLEQLQDPKVSAYHAAQLSNRLTRPI